MSENHILTMVDCLHKNHKGTQVSLEGIKAIQLLSRITLIRWSKPVPFYGFPAAQSTIVVKWLSITK